MFENTQNDLNQDELDSIENLNEYIEQQNFLQNISNQEMSSDTIDSSDSSTGRNNNLFIIACSFVITLLVILIVSFISLCMTPFHDVISSLKENTCKRADDIIYYISSVMSQCYKEEFTYKTWRINVYMSNYKHKIIFHLWLFIIQPQVYLTTVLLYSRDTFITYFKICKEYADEVDNYYNSTVIICLFLKQFEVHVYMQFLKKVIHLIQNDFYLLLLLDPLLIVYVWFS